MFELTQQSLFTKLIFFCYTNVQKIYKNKTNKMTNIIVIRTIKVTKIIFIQFQIMNAILFKSRAQVNIFILSINIYALSIYSIIHKVIDHAKLI